MKIAAIGTWNNVTNCPAATPLGTSYPTMWLVGNLYLRWRAGTYPQTFVPKLKLVSWCVSLSLWAIFAFLGYWASRSFMADPVRDLNNFLQSQPAGNGGNATRDFEWVLKREGPEHCTTYHVTAVCEHCDNISLPFIHFFFYNSPGSQRWGWSRLYKGHCKT